MRHPVTRMPSSQIRSALPSTATVSSLKSHSTERPPLVFGRSAEVHGGPGLPISSFNFSRIPLHAPPRPAAGPEVAVRQPGDMRERKGERTADDTEERRHDVELAPSASWAPLERAPSETDLKAKASLPVEREPRFDFSRSFMLRSIQRKPTISSPGDAHEREADEVADKVMRMAEPAPIGAAPVLVQRKCATCEDDEESKTIQAKRASSVPGEVVLDTGAAVRTAERGGERLSTSVRQHFEPRFGFDFSRVRIHADGEAAQAAQAVQARAYTVGQNIVFGRGEYAPSTVEGGRLLAHELTHVIQQTDTTGSARPSAVQRDEAEPRDAGVDEETLPGGVRDPPKHEEPAEMVNAELGPALLEAQKSGNSDRVEAIEAEIEKRTSGWGTAAPEGPGTVTSGVGAVTLDVALKLLENMSRGAPAFKPDQGLGGCSWFTTEGNPYTATAAAKSINVQVEINKGTAPLVFKEADLVNLFDAESAPAALQAEVEYRAKFNIDSAAKLSGKARKAISRQLLRLTEKRMWTRLGEKVAASTDKVGEVVLEPGSRFSRSPGKFVVVADATKITLKGGTGPLVAELMKAGVSAEPTVVAAAEALAKQMKWAGRIRAVFRYGGKVLIVVGVTVDVIKIFIAQDHLKATIMTVEGWAGATAAGAAFAAWWTPADTAGPWAWTAHGVGTLVAGGVGYWIGSETVRYIYELGAEP
jgi:Domain of unknown function (DUF4157)